MAQEAILDSRHPRRPWIVRPGRRNGAQPNKETLEEDQIGPLPPTSNSEEAFFSTCPCYDTRERNRVNSRRRVQVIGSINRLVPREPFRGLATSRKSLEFRARRRDAPFRGLFQPVARLFVIGGSAGSVREVAAGGELCLRVTLPCRGEKPFSRHRRVGRNAVATVESDA